MELSTNNQQMLQYFHTRAKKLGTKILASRLVILNFFNIEQSMMKHSETRGEE